MRVFHLPADGGPRVSLDGDGRADVLAAPGPGTAPLLHATTSVRGALEVRFSFTVFPGGFAGGAFPAVPRY